jgi:hypothetical protein
LPILFRFFLGLNILISFVCDSKNGQCFIPNNRINREQWLTPVILATWEVELRGSQFQRITVLIGEIPSQPMAGSSGMHLSYPAQIGGPQSMSAKA